MRQIVPVLSAGGDARGDWRAINALAANAEGTAARLEKALADIERLKRAAGGRGGGTIKAYKVNAESDDYLTAKLWTGGATTGSNVSIAKPPYLRISQQPSVDHSIYPSYTTAVIYAVEVDGGTDVEGVTLLDLNTDARKWAYAIDFCEDDTDKTALVDMGPIT